MVLRLVYSFLFLSLITGTLGFVVTSEAKTPVEPEVPCEKACKCQDQLDLKAKPDLSSSLPSHTQVRSDESYLRMIKSRYGYRTAGLPSSNSAHAYSTVTTSHVGPSVIDVLNENRNYQVPRPIQVIEEEKQVAGKKTICFTPKTVHRLVKAALEYFTKMPSDLNQIINLIDEDLDSVPELSLEEQSYKLYKPKHSGERTNVILQYEVPGTQEQPQCKEALDRLIDIFYNAYLELLDHPQCKDYLYNYASHQPEDQPTGHTKQAPGLKTLIITLLDQIDKKRPKPKYTTPESDRYGDMRPGDELPIHKLKFPKNHAKGPFHDYPTKEYRFPTVEYQTPTNEYLNPTTEYIFSKKEYLPTKEYHIPMPDYHIPHKEYIPTKEYRIPAPDYHIPKKEYIHTEEYSFPAPEYHIPKKEYIPIEEYRIPAPEFDIPKKEYIPTEEYLIPDDYRFPGKAYQVPQVHLPMPQPQEITILDSEEMEMPEIIQPVMPVINQSINPEDIIDYIIKILDNHDNAPIVDLIDNVKYVTDSHPQNINPYIMRLLEMLTFVPKENNDIPRFIEILTNLLNSQKNQQWPLTDAVTEQILSFVKPDQSGTIDTRVLDIILNLIKMKPHEKQVEHILHLLQPYKDGNLDQILVDILIRLINAQQNHTLRPEYMDTLLLLLKKSKNGIDEPKGIDVANNLDRWNEMGINPKQLDLIFNNLKPYVEGQTDSKPLDIIHFLLTKSKTLSRPQIDFILTFLNPSERGIDIKRIDIVHFLLGIMHMYPTQVSNLLELLMEDAPGVMNSRFMDILIFLENEGLLTPELLDIITNLLRNDVIGELEEPQLKSLLLLLKPYKQSNPKMVVDILTLLNQGGLHSNLLDWFKSPEPDFVEVPISSEIDFGEQHGMPSNSYETPENDVSTIIDWLHNQGLLNPDSGANSELVNNIVKILQLGDRELGVVELTYMLKHMKPLIYHPVYYVKYRLPIMSFITNLKALLTENPHLAANPMKLLQELILISNVTEVSPNLQGYPKDEIMKLTFNGGDLVQAKVLEEQNLNLNDQITYVQSLNSDITPQDLLELNQVNQAKFYPTKVVKFEESIPEKIVINKVVVPPTHYHFESGPIITQGPIRTIHNFIQRSNDKPVPPEDTKDSNESLSPTKPTPTPPK